MSELEIDLTRLTMLSCVARKILTGRIIMVVVASPIHPLHCVYVCVCIATVSSSTSLVSVCLSVSLSLFLCVSSSLGRIRRLVARALDVRHAPQLLFKPSWASGGDSAAAMSDAFRRIEEELQNDADESGDDSDTESSQRERRSDGDDAV